MSNDIQETLKTAVALFKAGQLDQSEVLLKELLAQDPDNSYATYSLGLVLFVKQDYLDAEPLLKKATHLIPDDSEVFTQYGCILHRLAKYNDAVIAYKRAIELNSENLQSINNLTAILIQQGKLTDAKKLSQRAIQLKPDYAESYINLGNLLKDIGEINAAITNYQKALSISPTNIIARSNLLLALHYIKHSREMVFKEHLKWEDIRTDRTRVIPAEKTCITKKDKIRIGYISGDFRTHSVSFFIEPILANHNLKEFEIFCYSDVINPDPVTIRLSKYPVNWRSIFAKNDQEVEDIIKKDQIDILVDLAGHAGNKRLQMFLNKPAPIITTYCGYPDTTGLSTINYRFTDNLSDPDGSDKFYTEKLFRLPDTFLCYRPPKDSPEICNTPAIDNKFVTFGSFNTLAKLSDATISLWTKILLAIPNSKLLIKTKQFNDENIAKEFSLKFESKGIPSNRLKLMSYENGVANHLQLYNKIDIALDPFPYNGTTTTCEALWMGVPVVSLIGESHVERVGFSLLSTIGLSELATTDTQRYIDLCKFLSEDIDRLNSLRLGIRNKTVSSKLCNAPIFTANIEAAYKRMIFKKSNIL